MSQNIVSVFLCCIIWILSWQEKQFMVAINLDSMSWHTNHYQTDNIISPVKICTLIWIILLKYHFNFESNLFMIDLGHNIPRPLNLFGLNNRCTSPNKTYLRINKSWPQSKLIASIEARIIVGVRLIVGHKPNTFNTHGTDFPTTIYFMVYPFFAAKIKWRSCAELKCYISAKCQKVKYSNNAICVYEIWLPKYSHLYGLDTFYDHLSHKISTVGIKSINLTFLS
jgi:hypothetical protein